MICQNITNIDSQSFEIADINKNKSPKLIRLKSRAEELWDTEENNRSKDWGKLLHFALSSINKIDDVDNVINKLLLSGRCNEEEKNKLQQNILSLISHTSIAPYFKADLDIKNEQEILLQNGKTYIPDRLIFNDDNVIVLDYKTGKKRKKDEDQIATYAQTLRLMGYKVVKTKIIYLDDYIK